MATVDWADLTDEQVKTLVTSPALYVRSGAERLGLDLSVGDDISVDLDATNATVQWDGFATVSRGCTVTLLQELNWATDLLRIYQTLTDTVTGLSARRNLGVFALATPDKPLAYTPASYQVSGLDRVYFLTREVGYSYVVLAGTSVLEAIAAVFTAAGLVGVQIDGSAATATVPTDMVWPLIPSTDIASAGGEQTSSPVADNAMLVVDSSSPATWLQIVNDLAGLINYRGVWCDENGFYRLGPYSDPASRASTFIFDATARACTVSIDRVVSRTVNVVNKWIFKNATLPDVAGVPAVPVEGDGIYTVENVTDGPASINALGGAPLGIWPTQIEFAAADQDALVAQGDARVAADKRVVATAKVSTSPFPAASHFDIFTWVDDGIVEGSWKVEATSWTLSLAGNDTQWYWTKVG